MGYQTVEEMRRDAAQIEKRGEKRPGSTRFEGSTDVETALKFLPKGRILDCGALFGEFAEFLRNNGWSEIYTLDFVTVLDESIKKHVTHSAIDFNHEKFPYPDNFFDGVSAWGIGEHLENPFFFAREVSRVLKPGGVFIFSVPNVFHIISRLMFLKKGLFPRWNLSNNHISILPHGVFEKTFLKYFDLVSTVYIKPAIEVSFLRRLSRYLPRNEWFANYNVYVLQKRDNPKT